MDGVANVHPSVRCCEGRGVAPPSEASSPFWIVIWGEELKKRGEEVPLAPFTGVVPLRDRADRLEAGDDILRSVVPANGGEKARQWEEGSYGVRKEME